jgi:gamma-glutamylcysteine synthetase
VNAAVAAIGHNNPPEPTAFEQAEVEILMLFDQAKGFLDGEPIANRAQADAVGTLDGMIMKARKVADELRVEEKRPHDEAAKAVQEKFKPLLTRCDLARDACKQALTPYLRKLEDEKRAKAEEACKAAEEERRKAQEAMQAAHRYDLEAREAAEAQLKQAEEAEKTARRAEKDKAHVAGAGRAKGLRTAYRAEVTDYTTFARHLWASHKDEYQEFLDGMAAKLVQHGVRGETVPGLKVYEVKVI